MFFLKPNTFEKNGNFSKVTNNWQEKQIMTINLHIKAYKKRELVLHSTKNIDKHQKFTNTNSLLSGAATRFLVDRLSSDLHCWRPSIVRRRLACHPVNIRMIRKRTKKEKIFPTTTSPWNQRIQYEKYSHNTTIFLIFILF